MPMDYPRPVVRPWPAFLFVRVPVGGIAGTLAYYVAPGNTGLRFDVSSTLLFEA
jgi:hypothetical protein